MPVSSQAARSGRASQLLTLTAAAVILMVTGRWFVCEGLAQAGTTKKSSQRASAGRMSAADATALSTALELYDQGKLREAEASLTPLAAKYPDNFEANEALGSLFAEANDFNKALPLLERAVKAAPERGVGHANLGAVLAKLQRNREALSELKIAATLDPSNAATQSAYGHLLIETQQPARAAEAFAAAVAIDSQNWELRYNWAVALASSGNVTHAQQVLQAIPANEFNEQTHALAGDLDERLGKYEESVHEYTAAAQANPSEANLYALTVEFLRHWTWDAALRTANYASGRYPDSRRLRVAAGIALYGGSKYSEASAAFSALLGSEPNNAFYADLLGRSCGLIAEGTSESCNGLERFATEHPENAQAATYAAMNILHQPVEHQDLDKALALLQQAIHADPKLAEAYYQLGVLQQLKTDWEGSITSLQTAIALDPATPEPHYRLARAYFHVGKRAQGNEQIELQKKYSEQAKQNLNAKLNQVTTFLVTMH